VAENILLQTTFVNQLKKDKMGAATYISPIKKKNTFQVFIRDMRKSIASPKTMENSLAIKRLVLAPNRS